MKRIFSQLLAPRSYYVTTTTTTKTSPPVAVSPGQKKVQKNQRTITISTGQGSIPPVVSTIPSHSIPPPPPGIQGGQILYQMPRYEIPSEEPPEGRHFYNSLLNRAIDLSLEGTQGPEGKGWLLGELSLKRVLSKNEEMKKVILKVAAMALAHNESGEVNHKGLHPFIPTAGEVFFGANYTKDEVEGQEDVQDILTPGLLILLLDKMILPSHSGIPQMRFNDTDIIAKRHLLLAKALVETVAGYLIHRTVQETNHLSEDTKANQKHFETMHQGNKLATLTGDLLVVSLIKNVSCTGNNKVLELVMNSLSEFSTTEIARRQKPFQPSPGGGGHVALLPKTLAESIVFSKGFQSGVLLSGNYSPGALEWAGELGDLMGLLWKTNFDFGKLAGERKHVENIKELNSYLEGLRTRADLLLINQGGNHQIANVFRQFIHFWGGPKRN